MRYTKQDIGRIASAFLNELEHQGINTFDDLTPRIGRRFPMQGSNNEYLFISRRSSAHGTFTLKCSYIVEPKRGIPLDLSVNRTMGVSEIFLKATEKLNGFQTFTEDPFGNYVQCKPIVPPNFEDIKGTLRELSSMLA
jgi:hypothetical protein